MGEELICLDSTVLIEYFRNTVLPFENRAYTEAIKIYRSLKTQNKLIGTADLLIGATARALELKLATLNKKHFERIDELSLVTP